MAKLTFPSVEWFQALADSAKQDEGYRKFGRLNAIAVFKVGDRQFSVNFDVLNIHEVKEVDQEFARGADFVVELEPDHWRQMLQDIEEHGHATGEWTLNTLDLRFDEPIHQNLMEDGYRADMFFMYNPSLQRFFDNASKLEYEFDLAAATA